METLEKSNNSNDDRIKELEDDLFKYAVQYENSSLDKEELKAFCTSMVEYCKLTRHAECKLATPVVTFEKIINEDKNRMTLGRYSNNTNTIKINMDYLDENLSKRRQLSDLIDTIGHEMEHYHQNSNLIEYENSSIEQQERTDKKIKASINSFKNNLYLNKESAKALFVLLAPYCQINDGVDVDAFYSNVCFISYYTLLSEKEAREAGLDFASHFYQNLSTSKYQLSSDVFKSKKDHIDEIQEDNDRLYDKRMKDMDMILNIREEVILTLVKNIESTNGSLMNLDINDYQVALKFLIKNKTMEQKESLFKNAIFNGYNLFADIIVESLQDDVDFKANKNQLSSFVRDCLTGKAYGDSKVDIPPSSYNGRYAKILNQEDLEECVTKAIEKDSFFAIYNASCFFTYNKELKTFSLESMLKCQEIVLKKKSDEYAKGDEVISFFRSLFEKVEMKQKIEYLQCEELKPEFKEILVECIRNDSLYESFRDKIDPIINYYTIPTEDNLINPPPILNLL